MSTHEYLLTQSGELYHHGIKGMKWGVRRYQNKDGTLTEAGKKRVRSYTNDYENEDFTITRGQKLHRVGSGSEEDSGRTYVSYGDADYHRYINYYDTLGATHKIEMKALNDLKVAKGKVLAETYVEMLESKSVSELASYKKPYIVRGKETRNSKNERRDLEDTYKKASKDKESFDKSFATFSAGLMSKSSISDEYFTRLKAKGYNAMYDFNDRKAADNPLLVFDRGSDLVTTKVSEITGRDVDQAFYWLESRGLW